MQIKVTKEGKVKTYRFIKSWEDVTLEKWVRLVDLRNGSKTKEALETVKILSDMPKKIIKELGIKDIAAILERVARMQKEARSELKKIIEVNGVEYGMHPNLEDMSLGEWADIETFLKIGLDKTMPDIMAVLFRPIVEKRNNAYIIPPYDGNTAIRAEEFKKMKAIDVQNALVFFSHLGKAFSIVMPSYLMSQTEILKKELEEKSSQTNGVTSD